MAFFKDGNKQKGIIGTILFHAIILLLCFIFGLSYQIPPPEEEGISINFGDSPDGNSEIEPESTNDISQQMNQETAREQNVTETKLLTQELQKAPAIENKQSDNKIKEETEPKPQKEEQKVNQKALYQGKKNNQQTQEGVTGKGGNQGAIDGDPNAKNHTGGGIGTDGIAFHLGGRNVEFTAKPIYNVQEEGTVVVVITVDQLGNVINAIPGAKGSTTFNKYLLDKAKDAALKTKFNPNQNAPENQQGKIIYHFSLH